MAARAGRRIGWKRALRYDVRARRKRELGARASDRRYWPDGYRWGFVTGEGWHALYMIDGSESLWRFIDRQCQPR